MPDHPADDPTANSIRDQDGSERVVHEVERGTDGAGAEGHAAAFEMWTDAELHARAAELGLDVAGLSRAEVIAAIEDH